MRFTTLKKLSLLVVVLLLGATACSLIGAASTEATPTPAPTSFIQGLKTAPSQACQVASQPMIRVEQPQGDLVSWSPNRDVLAYIAPAQGSSWNVGELTLLSAPGFDAPARLATQAAGELSWSPKGDIIAFLSLRRSDNLYSIGLAYPDGQPAVDLFPGEGARTDGFSSQKAIVEWMDERHLRVLASCAVNCLQGYDFNVESGISSLTGDSIPQMNQLWKVHASFPAILPPAYTKLKGQMNWSPDENRVAYIDEDGGLWVVDVRAGSLSALDIGTYGTASETDWSYNSQYLAVHVDQELRIFSFKCP